MSETVGRYRLGLVRDKSFTYDSDHPLRRPEDVGPFLSKVLGDHAQEHMVAIYLDSGLHVIGWSVLHVGTTDRVACDPRAVIQTALLLNAKAFVLGHNHPSGRCNPSTEDVAVTKRIFDAAALFGIDLLDHVIIGEGGRWKSLRGLLAGPPSTGT